MAMVDRRSLATGVLALLVVAGSGVIAGQAPAGQAPGGAAGQAPAGPGATGQPAGAPGRGAGGAGGGQGRGGAGGGGGRGGGRAAAYTPPAGSKELKDVLYNWAWHMGMLRSGAESELIKTLEYLGDSGTMQVNGQPCAITKYRYSINYQLPGYRNQITCTRANGQPYSIVENFSGDYAWDDDIPGAELVPGKGKSTPNPEAYRERVIRLWASPQGALKSAIAAAAGLPVAESFGQNPATLLDRQAAAGVKGTTTLTWQGEKAILTFPIPGLPGVTATATLDNYLAERVVVKNGTNTMEFVYSDYGDFNNPLFKIEALMPGTIVERKNGTAVRTVKSKVTEVGQVYVVVPVPDSVQKAGPAKK